MMEMFFTEYTMNEQSSLLILLLRKHNQKHEKYSRHRTRTHTHMLSSHEQFNAETFDNTLSTE